MADIPTGADNPFPSLRRVDVPSLAQEKAAFRERIVGQEEAVDSFAGLLIKLKSGIRSPGTKPIDAKFLAGPSGVGKTEMVYTLADILTGGAADARDKVLKLNGGEYQTEQRHNLARLLGSPPGYRGSEDPAIPGSGTKVLFSQENLDSHRIYYTDRNGNQRSVIFILVDEAEKADRSFHMAFLSILDKGQLDIGNNTTSNFSDTVIFYTSNVGNEKVEQLHQQRATQQTEQAIPDAFREAFGGEAGEASFSAEDKEIIRHEFTNAFPPEFRGRIRETVVFNHLSKEAVATIARMKVSEVEQSFAENGIRIELDLTPTSLEWLTKHGYSRSEGARGMEKLVERVLHETLIKLDSARDTDELSTGIHRKRIGVDIKEDGSGFDFYFGDGYQLEDFQAEQRGQSAVAEQQEQGLRTDSTPQLKSQPPPILKVGPPLRIGQPLSVQRPPATEQRTAQASQTSEVPQVPERIRSNLVFNMREYGLDSYARERDKLVSQGLLDPAAANALPEIRHMASSSLLFELREYGLNSYVKTRNKMANAGIFSINACNNWAPIKEMSQNYLTFMLREYGITSFTKERDKYVAAGIGTVEEWNQLLNS